MNQQEAITFEDARDAATRLNRARGAASAAITYANSEKAKLNAQKTIKQADLAYWTARPADGARTAALAQINTAISDLDARIAVFDTAIAANQAI